HARRGQVIAARIVGHAVKGGGVGCRVGRDRRIADRRGVATAGISGGRDAAAQQGRAGAGGPDHASMTSAGACAHGSLRVPFRSVPAVTSPLLTWLELTTTVLWLPWTTTFRLLPMAVEPPMVEAPLPRPAPA